MTRRELLDDLYETVTKLANGVQLYQFEYKNKILSRNDLNDLFDIRTQLVLKMKELENEERKEKA